MAAPYNGITVPNYRNLVPRSIDPHQAKRRVAGQGPRERTEMCAGRRSARLPAHREMHDRESLVESGARHERELEIRAREGGSEPGHCGKDGDQRTRHYAD